MRRKKHKHLQKDAAQAWHDARDAAAAEGGWGVPANRHGEGGKSGGSSKGGGGGGKSSGGMWDD